ncbi:hypothetical protein [Streptobacillus ratti]|uniref:hypothetical protein n=1 Tax=Streptobacillus ratti TaxID=1720557 RepID=UPI000934BE9F|nr:hypothetical protein [Streptobacillus ratti]
MKKIPLKTVIKIANLLFDIFCLEDEDFVDRRKTKPKYQKLYRRLKNINENKEEQRKIWHAIERELFNDKDYTYKCMCDNLRELGYEITYD